MGEMMQQRSPARARSAILASADSSFRQRLRDALVDLRWQVREASGGAETLACLDSAPAETVVIDSWLPDLEIREFIAEFERLHPDVDLIMADASDEIGRGLRSPRRNEVLHALRRAQASDGAAWNSAPEVEVLCATTKPAAPTAEKNEAKTSSGMSLRASAPLAISPPAGTREGITPLPELIGSHRSMLEISRRIRLVAPRTTPVLIQGPTGTGKELVARAIHRLSPRSTRGFVALNCAAIPETLLEAELFGHTRGAFTGAVQGRTGRIEAAHGGTLFLDEIGEMPQALQAKLLRFLESGELQRVGDNQNVHVDARIVAATHRPLAQLALDGLFRADLFYRLSVFLISTPALGGRSEDIGQLTERFLSRLARESPAKQMTAAALSKVVAHSWPGNVRELEHVIERAWILADDRPLIDVQEIEFDLSL